MIYDTTDIRRQDRLLDRSSAEQLLRTAEYGVLSMCDEDGKPYAVPINFVWDDAATIYLHCAPEGKKLRAIAHNPSVSLCVVGRVALQANLFTTEYESVIVSGTATVVTDDDERWSAIRLLLHKFAPDYEMEGTAAAKKSLHRLAMIRLEMNCVSGKSKRIKDNV